MAVFSSPNSIAEIALAVLTLCMTSLAILSVTRRRIILLLSTAISPICYSLVFYMIGISLSAHPSSRDDDSASLACSALLLVGLAKSIVIHSFQDGHKTLSASLYEQLLQMVFVLVLVLPPWSFSFGHRALFGTLVGAVFLHWVDQLEATLLFASARSRIEDDLLISEYMSRKHNQVLDPTDFRGLSYIVSGEVATRDSLRFLLKHVIKLAMGLRRKVYNPALVTGACIPPVAIPNRTIRYDTLVTVGDIWKTTGAKCSESRDVCLSFALFKLLRRRFRGCFLHESGHDNTRQFVLRGLVSPNSANPLRAFHIIEAELGFVFDFFYTTRMHFTDPYMALALYAAYLTFRPSSNNLQKDVGTAKVIVHRLLSAIVLLFPILGFLQSVSSSLSNWYKVNLVVYICRRRKRSTSSSRLDSIIDSILLPMMRISRIGSTWTNRAGQYCLFHGNYRGFNTCQISNQAKEALLNALRLSDGKLSDGRSSLSRNGADTLEWACDQEFVAEKILVWHIATTLCHVRHHASKSGEASDYQVATLLSGYCAYLVGFAPELVADDMYATRLAFDNARVAARERLEGEGTLARMCHSAAVMELDTLVIDFGATAQHDVVFKGKMLAGQLMKLPDETQWKVLAEFWAELMLFVSPSHNSAAHLERLKDGGELITHIWALLTHAGILERPSGRYDHTAANQTSVDTSMRGEATTSVPSQTEIQVVSESFSEY